MNTNSSLPLPQNSRTGSEKDLHSHDDKDNCDEEDEDVDIFSSKNRYEESDETSDIILVVEGRNILRQKIYSYDALMHLCLSCTDGEEAAQQL